MQSHHKTDIIYMTIKMSQWGIHQDIQGIQQGIHPARKTPVKLLNRTIICKGEKFFFKITIGWLLLELQVKV